MSLATYGDLKTGVQNWLNRSDLSSYIPDFINLAATRIYYGSDDSVLPSMPVRTWSMMAAEAPTATNGVITLPARFLSTIKLSANDGGQGFTLQYKSPSQIAVYDNAGNLPQTYTILNGAIYLGGTGSGLIFRHDYYQRFADFSADTDTNDFLTSYPGLFLNAALLEANIFLGDDENAKKHHRLFNGIASGITNTAKDLGVGSLAVRVS